MCNAAMKAMTPTLVATKSIGIMMTPNHPLAKAAVRPIIHLADHVQEHMAREQAMLRIDQ